MLNSSTKKLSVKENMKVRLLDVKKTSMKRIFSMEIVD
jgi:hypothetical protein